MMAFMRCPPISQKAYFAHFRDFVTPFRPASTLTMTVSPRLPGERRGSLIEPVILGDHLVRTRIAEPEEPKDHQHDRVDDIVLQREHRAFEQCMMDEADGYAQPQHVEKQRQVRAPGLGAGLACHPCRPAAQQNRDEQELPDRGLFVEDALHGFRLPASMMSAFE